VGRVAVPRIRDPLAWYLQRRLSFPTAGISAVLLPARPDDTTAAMALRQRPLRPLSSATDLTDMTDMTHSTLEADVRVPPTPRATQTQAPIADQL